MVVLGFYFSFCLQNFNFVFFFLRFLNNQCTGLVIDGSAFLELSLEIK